MKKILVLFLGLSMILVTGCSLGPKEEDIADGVTIVENTGDVVTPVPEDKEIQDFFDFIEKTIQEEVQRTEGSNQEAKASE